MPEMDGLELVQAIRRDYPALPVPTDSANIERIGGRGLMLIRTFMDDAEPNAKGSRITLRERYRAAELPG
jgi:Histidine kinase-like ATPase domain